MIRFDSGRTRRTCLHRAFAICGVLACAIACAPVFAQAVLEEIIVTSQKREQDIQKVPIAVSAFTSETLKAKAVTDIHSLTNLTPNVNLDASSPFSGDSSVLSASIRGIGQDDFAFNLDPGVGVYLDGVFLARTIGANQNLLDVDRVEILKGPQGTLFGRNTIGGAINIVTHVPGKEFSFSGEATGGSYNRTDLGFTADLPISEKLLSSITVSSQERDGYQDVIPYPAGTPLGDMPFVVDPTNAYPTAGHDSADSNGGQNLQVIRGKLLWQPSDSMDVTFTADYQHQDQPSTPATVLSVNTTPANIFGYIYNTCISTSVADLNAGNAPIFGPRWNVNDGLCRARANTTPELGASGGASLGGAGFVSMTGSNPLSPAPRIFWEMASTDTGDIDKTYANGVSFAKNDVWGASLTFDWDLGSDTTL